MEKVNLCSIQEKVPLKPPQESFSMGNFGLDLISKRIFGTLSIADMMSSSEFHGVFKLSKDKLWKQDCNGEGYGAL